MGWYTFNDNHNAFCKGMFYIHTIISILIIPVIVFLPVMLFAQETYNLEVIFKKTSDIWPGYEGFGSRIASAGDVNADGFDDIIIWAKWGQIFVFCIFIDMEKRMSIIAIWHVR